jgi:hypothetical protein
MLLFPTVLIALTRDDEKEDRHDGGKRGEHLPPQRVTVA